MGQVTVPPHPRHQRQPPGFTWGTGHTVGRAKPSGPRRLPLCVTPVNTLAYQGGGPPDQAPPPPARAETRGRRRRRHPAWVSTHQSARAVPHRYGNINPSPIDYACRPRLRPRLTQGGRTFPWNPWSHGAGDSHPGLATHACILTPAPSTRGHPTGFTQHRTLPYHPRTPSKGAQGSAASAARLSPATLSAHDHLTSELLRTLSRVAASKPTSWLSPRPHILSHLARA